MPMLYNLVYGEHTLLEVGYIYVYVPDISESRHVNFYF